MVMGSCLCEGVQYKVDGQLSRMGHCHCSMCRKAHGAAFGTYAKVAVADFSVLSGSELIERYESSPGIQRTFCRRCGSTLQYIAGGAFFALAVGTLDEDPGVRPEYHIWVGSKAPWYEFHDDLLSYESEPGGGNAPLEGEAKS